MQRKVGYLFAARAGHSKRMDAVRTFNNPEFDEDGKDSQI